MENLKPEQNKLIGARMWRLRMVLIVGPGLTALCMVVPVVLVDVKSNFWHEYIPREFFIAIMISCVIVSVASIVWTYLDTGFKKDQSIEAENIRSLYESESARLRENKSDAKKAQDLETSRIKSDIQSMQHELIGLKAAGLVLDKEQHEKLVDTVSARIKDEAIASLVKDIEKRVQVQLDTINRNRETDRLFGESCSRLQEEVEALGRRGNLNLSLGIFTTVAGLLTLGYFVITTGEEMKNQGDFSIFAIHFFPRLTLVIFIEIFAYFFLQLYKSSLSEIKYFQNEMTNLESHSVALRSAINAANPNIVGGVITHLSKTERNHALKKGETTVDIERARIEKDGMNEMLKNISSIFKGKK